MYPAAEKGHRSLTSHLEKSIISNVIQTARACLNEPSRPYTPAEGQRALFNQNDYANRPPSSYVPKNSGRKPRNRSQEVSAPAVSARKEKQLIREPIRLQTRDLDSLDASLKTPEPVRPIKPRVEETKGQNQLKTLLQTLIEHEEARNLYGYAIDRTEEWEELATQVAALGNSGGKEAREELCTQTLSLVEVVTDAGAQIRLLKMVFSLLVQSQLLHQKPNGKLKPIPILLSAAKLIYQPSKQKENDPVYIQVGATQTGIMSFLYEIVVKLMSDDCVELDGGEESLPFQTLVYLLGTIKNLTDEEQGRQQALDLGLIVVLARLMPLPERVSPNVHPEFVYFPCRNNSRAQMLVQVTGILRNFAGEKSTYGDMLLGQVVDRSIRTLELFFSHSELVFNTCRVLSKLSIDEKCAVLMLDKENLYAAVSLLQRVMLAYSENAPIVSRLGFTLANLAMLYEEARAVVGAEGFDTVVETVLIPYLSLSSSKTHFDALLKTIRLLANVVLDPETGTEMTKGGAAVNVLAQVLQQHSSHEEMTLITVSCLANVLYYDHPQRPVVAEPTVRTTLVRLLSPSLMQTANFELTREALRALSNLTRHEEAAREVSSAQLIEPLLLLLDHGVAEIVFYALGCITNLSHLAKEFIYTEMCFDRFVTLLEEVGTQTVDISLQVSMVLANLCSPTKGLVPWEGVAGDETVKRLSSLVTTLISEAKGREGTEQLFSVLKTLKDAMPATLLPCPERGCGRKFANQEKLQEHWERRHNS